MGSDLRAAEQTYQLLSQVAGRAGRGEKSGEVWIQTLYPENAVLQALVDNDRGRFLELEKQTRQMLKLPPFGRLAALVVSGENQTLTERAAAELGAVRTGLRTGFPSSGPGAGADIHAA